jgi:hypothetical protein
VQGELSDYHRRRPASNYQASSPRHFFAEQRDEQNPEIMLGAKEPKMQTLIIGHGRYLEHISSWSGASSPLNYVVRVACSSEDTGSTIIAGVSRAGAGRGIFEYSQADYLA